MAPTGLMMAGSVTFSLPAESPVTETIQISGTLPANFLPDALLPPFLFPEMEALLHTATAVMAQQEEDEEEEAQGHPCAREITACFVDDATGGTDDAIQVS